MNIEKLGYFQDVIDAYVSGETSQENFKKALLIYERKIKDIKEEVFNKTEPKLPIDVVVRNVLDNHEYKNLIEFNSFDDGTYTLTSKYTGHFIKFNKDWTNRRIEKRILKWLECELPDSVLEEKAKTETISFFNEVFTNFSVKSIEYTNRSNVYLVRGVIYPTRNKSGNINCEFKLDVVNKLVSNFSIYGLSIEKLFGRKIYSLDNRLLRQFSQSVPYVLFSEEKQIEAAYQELNMFLLRLKTYFSQENFTF